jgi:nitrite reductase/ring-hydroxylating ferredoxin subunit
MRSVKVGTLKELDDLRGHKIVSVDGLEIGLFRSGEEIFAWENKCPHRGGPVCQGKVIPRISEQLAADGSSEGFCFSKGDIHIVCPWHGFEFNVRTGRHPGLPNTMLKGVKLSVIEGNIHVDA